MVNFTGTMSYRSIQTGEVFLEVQYENGIPLPPETASNGRLPLSDGCYPDEAGRIECYTVYVTTTGDGGYTSSTTGINYNNHTFDEPDSPHTDVYNSCMVIDADFSSCYHTFFNTNGFTTYPQYYGGSSQGTLASTSLGPVYELVDLFSFLGNRWEENSIIDNNLKPCMQTIMTDLKNLSQGVGQIVTKFAGNVPGYNWETKNGVLSSNQNALTSQQYNSSTGTVTTTFDSNKFGNASDLSVARTILHEAVHANIVASFGSNYSAARITFSDFMKDFSSNKYPTRNDVDHAEFVRNYVNDIASALQEYGNNFLGYNLSSQFYSDLAWGGLTHWTKLDTQGNPVLDSQGNRTFEETPWFKSKHSNQADRNRVLNTINDEQGNNGTSNQKGANAGC